MKLGLVWHKVESMEHTVKVKLTQSEVLSYIDRCARVKEIEKEKNTKIMTKFRLAILIHLYFYLIKFLYHMPEIFAYKTKCSSFYLLRVALYFIYCPEYVWGTEIPVFFLVYIYIYFPTPVGSSSLAKK